MVTKWRSFSRNKITKLFLFVVMLASLIAPFQMILSSVRDGVSYYFELEPMFERDYQQSDYHHEEVRYAYVDVLASLNNKLLSEEGIERYILNDYGLTPEQEDYNSVYDEIIDSFREQTAFHLEHVDTNYRYYASFTDKSGVSVVDSNTDRSYFTGLNDSAIVYSLTDFMVDHGIGTIEPEYSFNTLYSGEVQAKLSYDTDYLENQQQEWDAVRDQLVPIIAWAVIGIVGFFISFIWLLIVTGRKAKDNAVHLCWVDRIFTEITIALILISGGLAVALVSYQVTEWDYMVNYGYYSGYEIWAVICSCGLVACGAVLFACLLSVVRNLKNRTFLKKMLLCHLFRWIGRLFKKIGTAVGSLTNGKHFKEYAFQRGMFTRQLIFVLSEMGMILLTVLGAFVPPLFVFPLVGGLVILAWYANGYARINEQMGSVCGQIERIAEGDLDSKLILPEDSLLINTAEKLNEIGGGMQKSIEAQMKGERMKVDLITNVSHDLKTPLTSIISYVDLLKKEDLSEEARDYVNILAQKSDRLKHIVSDLFDLAKSTSGNAQINMEELDIKRLLEQTLGDMEDRISASGKTMRMHLTEYPVPVMGDGGKLYRVFQNVIDNALKYSLDGTRIYIDMNVRNGEIVVSVKNIASYEMDFTSEEILERFARGDKSRTTEGNGLGLSIAKSFTEVCGGRFFLEIDGDQFKSNIAFPIHRCTQLDSTNESNDQQDDNSADTKLLPQGE